MRLSSRTLALMGRYQLATLALGSVVAARVGRDAVAGVVEGGALVAANLWLSRRLLPWTGRPASILGRSPSGPAARLLAVAAVKLVAQLSLATAMLLWWPPMPAAFLAGLATFVVALLATAVHGTVRTA